MEVQQRGAKQMNSDREDVVSPAKRSQAEMEVDRELQKWNSDCMHDNLTRMAEKLDELAYQSVYRFSRHVQVWDHDLLAKMPASCQPQQQTQRSTIRGERKILWNTECDTGETVITAAIHKCDDGDVPDYVCISIVHLAPAQDCISSAALRLSSRKPQTEFCLVDVYSFREICVVYSVCAESTARETNAGRSCGVEHVTVSSSGKRDYYLMLLDLQDACEDNETLKDLFAASASDSSKTFDFEEHNLVLEDLPESSIQTRALPQTFFRGDLEETWQIVSSDSRSVCTLVAGSAMLTFDLNDDEEEEEEL